MFSTQKGLFLFRFILYPFKQTPRERMACCTVPAATRARATQNCATIKPQSTGCFHLVVITYSHTWRGLGPHSVDYVWPCSWPLITGRMNVIA
jgi:hypothetical protein